MRITFVIFLLCFLLKVNGQGAFLSPMTEISEIDGTISLGAGAGAGIMMKRWLIGAYGMYTSKAGRAGDSGSLHDLNLTFGGIWLGYAQPANEYLAVTLGFKGAMGNARQEGITDAERQNDRFWLLTPEAGVDIALGRDVRIGLSTGYRIAGDVQLTAFTNKNLHTLVNTFSIKIGNLGRLR
ncbi:MAG: hypothetical protein ACK4TA_01410 [Saprospiraceae bacterium]